MNTNITPHRVLNEHGEEIEVEVYEYEHPDGTVTRMMRPKPPVVEVDE